MIPSYVLPYIFSPPRHPKPDHTVGVAQEGHSQFVLGGEVALSFTLSALAPKTAALTASKSDAISRNAQASLVQPGVLALG